jgi:hypothetical protein
MKPRIKIFWSCDRRLWKCEGGPHWMAGYGFTPRQAYDDWALGDIPF